ncbi:MAG: hypothetical protein DCE90_17155 [Pseudanabaena sp.]|nr:MAG: hypothetical protein DCE90_17155 [Pseudanabaena sp.]
MYRKLFSLPESGDKCHVFVYGTLKPEESNFEQYCANEIIAMQPAIAYGELFVLPMGYPAIVIDGGVQSAVYGYLFTFASDDILEALDELEEYQCDRAASENLYNRQQIEVFDYDKQTLGLAWIYCMDSTQVINLGGISQPSGIWTKD